MGARRPVEAVLVVLGEEGGGSGGSIEEWLD